MERQFLSGNGCSIRLSRAQKAYAVLHRCARGPGALRLRLMDPTHRDTGEAVTSLSPTYVKNGLVRRSVPMVLPAPLALDPHR